MAVNGQTVTPTDAKGFLGVSRVWQANDKIELAFPFFVQASRLPDNPNAVAFTYGPLVLSAGLGTAAMTTTGHAWTIAATSPGGLQDTIKIPAGTVSDWLSNIQKNLVQTPGKLEFKLKNTDSDDKLVFIPHYSRYQDRYGIYWKLSGGAGGTTMTTATCPVVTAGGPGGSGGMTGGGGQGGGGVGGGGIGSGGASAGTPQGGQPASGTSGSGPGGSSTGPAQASGGTAASAGGPASGTGGGQIVGGGMAGTAGAAADGSSGCGCQLGATDSPPSRLVAVLLGIGAGVLRRRRRAA
jgi:MYXO-CTERM domain-containing protein